MLTGILFVLKTGIPWKYLPKEMGCGSGMTVGGGWRLARGGRVGKIRCVLLQRLEDAEQIDWSRAVVDSTSVRAVFGGRRRPASHGSPQTWLEASRAHRCQRHPLGDDVDRGNAHHVPLIPLVDAIPNFVANVESGDVPNVFRAIGHTIPNPIAQACGGVAFDPCWPNAIPNTAAAWAFSLGRRTHEQLFTSRRLRLRFEKRPDFNEAFLTLGCIL